MHYNTRIYIHIHFLSDFRGQKVNKLFCFLLVLTLTGTLTHTTAQSLTQKQFMCEQTFFLLSEFMLNMHFKLMKRNKFSLFYLFPHRNFAVNNNKNTLVGWLADLLWSFLWWCVWYLSTRLWMCIKTLLVTNLGDHILKSKYKVYIFF